MTVNVDYVPRSMGNLQPWLQNFEDRLPSLMAALKMTQPEVDEFLGCITPMTSSIALFLRAQQSLDAASAGAQEAVRENLPELRRLIQGIKGRSSYTEAIGGELGILRTGSSFDPDSYKPELDAEAHAGYVRIRGRKTGADSIDIYTRLKGQSEWRLLVSRRGRFPFDDDTPLAVAGVPEVREYRGIGVLADAQIGQPSDIVSVVYGG